MDNEKEIPFGAFDSELMHQEINIPEGFEANIEGDKIILKKIESEDEKTRKEIIYHIKNCDDTIDEETEKKMLAWLEKQRSPKSAPMQNGIIINGVEYELIEDYKPDECERCALQELCKSIEDEVICKSLYGPNVASYHRFEKK